MFTFISFLNENQEVDSLKNHPVLSNFLHHLSSPTLKASDSLSEAHDIETIKASGQTNKPQGNLFHVLKEGFHAAFPENESADTTQRKAVEARRHFRNFMAERGGMSKDNVTNLTGENGKTALSTGEGMQTLGLSLAPHKSSGYKHDLCPKASSECRANCLGFTAGGNRQFPETSFRAKLLRTQYLAEHPEHAARLMSHEIGENEKWSSEHHFITDGSGAVVGHQNKKSGKITSHMVVNPKNSDGTKKTAEQKKAEVSAHVDSIQKGIDAGTHNTKAVKSGFRGNVTSDLPYESLMPEKFFKKHANTQFYDYTKIASRLKKKLPSNYSLALSHTGTEHAESNDKHVIDALENGHVVAMVHQRSKVTPTHVEDVKTEKRYPVVNGDNDDNVYDRHRMAGIPKSQGVVSGLKLKGVSNKQAGFFANKVDPDGIIRINK